MGQQIAAMEEQVLAGNRLPAPAVDALLANR